MDTQESIVWLYIENAWKINGYTSTNHPAQSLGPEYALIKC